MTNGAEYGGHAKQESRRLSALQSYRVLDSAPEAAFDNLVGLAATACDMPIAILCFIDDKRQWFKAACGLDAGQSPREIAFCEHTIRDPDALIVPDARRDPRFADNPFVTGKPHLRFYAGVPLEAGDGSLIGSLAIMDTVPRALDSTALNTLEALARLAIDLLDARLERLKLATSEERFRHAAEASQAALWDYDMASDRIEFSEAFRDMLGYARLEDMPRTMAEYLELMHPDDRERVRKRAERLVSGEAGDRATAEYRLLTRTGEYRWFQGNSKLIRDAEGRAVRRLGSTVDIHERKRAEQALADSEHHYRLLFHSNPHPMFVFDRESLRFLAVNDAAIAHYGYSREQFLSMTAKDIRPPEDVPKFEALMENPPVDFEALGVWRHRKADGTVFDVKISSHRLKFEGHVAELVLAQDVTRERALEDQLRQAQRLESVGQLTGGVAHDFNNLLTVILGNAELLAEHLESDQRLLRLADMTRAAAQRGAELTHRLLAFARRQPLDPRPTDIAGLLDGMKGLLQRSLPENIEIRVVRKESVWHAEIDPAQLESAVLNLSVNARDAMPDGGNLTIETANVTLDDEYARGHAEVEPGDYIMLAISDTGAGIPTEDIEQLFDPFFTTKEKDKGTGLGLAMVYGFIKQSRGHIMVYSEPGYGSTFKLYLPRSASTGTEVSAPDSELELEGAGERILIVEDDELVREHAERLLQMQGYETRTATNAADALALLEREPPFDLLFSDVVMPGEMNGLQLAQTALERYPGMRILLTSGYTEYAAGLHGELDKDVTLLQKPYRRIDLARKVRSVLKGEPSTRGM